MFSLKRKFIDINNLFYYRKKIKELKPLLERKGYKYDWIRRPYTIIDVERGYALNEYKSQSRKLNKHIIEMNDIFMRNEMLEMIDWDYDMLTEDKLLLYWDFPYIKTASVINFFLYLYGVIISGAFILLLL